MPDRLERLAGIACSATPWPGAAGGSPRTPPGNWNFDSDTGILLGAPDESTSGQQYTAVFSVTDNASKPLSASETITIQVQEANLHPLAGGWWPAYPMIGFADEPCRSING
jgi:hypothetical protein